MDVSLILTDSFKLVYLFPTATEVHVCHSTAGQGDWWAFLEISIEI